MATSGMQSPTTTRVVVGLCIPREVDCRIRVSAARAPAETAGGQFERPSPSGARHFRGNFAVVDEDGQACCLRQNAPRGDLGGECSGRSGDARDSSVVCECQPCR